MKRYGFRHLASACLVLALLLAAAPSAAQQPEIQNWTRSLVWSPDGRLIAVGTQYGLIRLVNTKGQTVRTLQEGDGKPVIALARSPNGLLLASGGADKQVTLWEIVSGKQVASLRSSASINGLSWHPDSVNLAIASADGSPRNISVWNVVTGEISFQLGISEAFTVAWKPDGRLLAVSRYKEIQVWDPFASPSQKLTQITTDPPFIVSLDWSSDGSQLASAQTSAPERNIVNVWNVATNQLILTYGDHEDLVRSIAWSPDDRYLASASADGTVRVWNPSTGETTQVFEEATALLAVDWDPNGGRLAYGVLDGVVKIVEVPQP